MEEKELQEIRKRLVEIDVRLLETIMSPPEINSMIEELEDFKKKCKGEKIEKEVVIQYSEILVSKILVSGISVSKINEKPQLEDIEEIEEYVRKLGNLKEEYPEIEDIAINYAEGIDCYERVRDYKSRKIIGKAKELANCEDQSIEETEKRVEEIKGLKEKYQGEEKIKKEIVKCYAEALFYLTKKQDSAGAEENLRKLKNLKRIYQKEEKIKNYYVKALANLTVKRELRKEKGLKKEYNRKEKIGKEVVVQYAKALCDLIEEQDLQGAKVIVRKLKEEYEKQKGKKEITILYVEALCNLTRKQDAERIVVSIGKIKELKEECQNQEQWLMLYMEALTNLVIKQDLAIVKFDIDKLRKLKEYYKKEITEKTEEIIVDLYVKALLSLIIRQDYQEAKDSVEELKKIKDTYKIRYKKTITMYAWALFNLIKKHKSERDRIKRTIEQKEKESEKLEKLEKSEELKELAKKSLEETSNTLILTLYVELIFSIYEDEEKIKTIKKEFSSIDIKGEIKRDSTKSNYKYLDKLLFWLNERDESKRKMVKENLIDILIIHFSYQKIMENLLFKESNVKLFHYTNVKVLPKLIKPKEENKISKEDANKPENLVRLRCNNTAYMNDPEEGKILYDYLQLYEEKEEEKERKHEYERQKKWLEDNIFSFTENKYGVYSFCLTKERDSLPMWQQYGAGGEGCCLGFSEGLFIGEKNYEIFNTKLIEEERILEKKQEKKAMKIYAYEVSYVGKTKLQKKEKETKEEFKLELDAKVKPYINLIRDSLWKIAEYFTEDKNLEPTCPDDLKTFLISCLDEIRYLFKSSDYSYEQEVRLLKQVPYSKDEVKLDCEREGLPRTYIEYPKDLEYTEVILGPKAPKREEVAPYIEYCNQKNGTSIKIRSSEIKYR